MSHKDLGDGRWWYGPILMPFARGGCLLPTQEEALFDLYGLNARVRYRETKGIEKKRQLTVVGPKSNEKIFEECAEEAMELIKSNYDKG